MSSSPLNLRQFESLVEIVRQLRGEAGCPWLKQHTHETLAPYAIEESFELVEAIESKTPNRDQNLKEELGDFAYQFVLHSTLAAERGAFTLEDVIEELNQKLIRRHPHVFANPRELSLEQIEREWSDIKKAEKLAKNIQESPLSTPPLPALQKAHRIGLKTAELQFDWNDAEGAWQKVEEEREEVIEAFKTNNIEELEHEIGDLLFSISHFARHLKLDPEKCLRIANRRFEERFITMLEIAAKEGHNWGSMSLADKDLHWQKAKKQLKNK